MTGVVVGIDVQAARDCPFAVLDSESRMIDRGWLPVGALTESVRALARRYDGACFAIDAPRMALTSPRSWYWRRRRWQYATGNEVGYGRHCEVVIAAHRIANPQWTPLADAAPAWMGNGFALFEALQERALTLEVFPSASYRMLNSAKDMRIEISLADFLPGPKDMLDALVAAVTAHEFLSGSGQEVGGGDGLGTIVLPRPIEDPISAVVRWPDDRLQEDREKF